jgi:hypothetical protein
MCILEIRNFKFEIRDLQVSITCTRARLRVVNESYYFHNKPLSLADHDFVLRAAEMLRQQREDERVFF